MESLIHYEPHISLPMLAISAQVRAVNLAWMRPVKFTQMVCIGLAVCTQFHNWMQIQSSHERLELFGFTQIQFISVQFDCFSAIKTQLELSSNPLRLPWFQLHSRHQIDTHTESIKSHHSLCKLNCSQAQNPLNGLL